MARGTGVLYGVHGWYGVYGVPSTEYSRICWLIIDTEVLHGISSDPCQERGGNARIRILAFQIMIFTTGN